MEAIHAYMRRLSASAAEQRLRGQEVRDQNFPVELFALRPADPSLPPLVLLGGMGPLAGAEGFARACSIFGESREIVLLQACSVPDRTRAVLADELAPVVRALEAALWEAIRHVQSSRRPIEVIVLCNAAHAFLPRMGSGVRLISLVECVVDALGRRRSRPALILSSLGTRVSRIFTRRLDEAGIAYVEPSDRIQDSLMRAIYDGLKALDYETASAAGAEVLDELLAMGADIGCIVAACTEIPPILDLLKNRLSAIDVVDPVELALRHAHSVAVEHAGAA